MKKLSALVLAGVLFFVGLVSVSAMSEADLKAKFEETLTLNGEKYGLETGILTLVERYMNEYDVSAADADYIATRIDQAKSIIESDGHPVFADFSQANKEDLRDLVLEIKANTSVRCGVTKNSVIVYESDGTTVFAEVTRLVKQTGSESSNIALMSSISLIIVLVGTLLVFKQAKATN